VVRTNFSSNCCGGPTGAHTLWILEERGPKASCCNPLGSNVNRSVPNGATYEYLDIFIGRRARFHMFSIMAAKTRGSTVLPAKTFRMGKQKQVREAVGPKVIGVDGFDREEIGIFDAPFSGSVTYTKASYYHPKGGYYDVIDRYFERDG
jgi:hypothetical protein